MAGALPWLVIAAFVAAPAAVGPAASDLRSADYLATHYDEDPSKLDAVIAALAAGTQGQPDVARLVALSRLSYIWGDVRAKTTEERLAAYQRGQDAAQKALAIDPNDVDARFWGAVNLGRWAQTKGLFRALAAVSTIKEEIAKVLASDPRHVEAHAFAGSKRLELPPMLGGDVQLAERMFREGLALDPHYTVLRVGLAKVLVRTGRKAEARAELERALAETAPRNPAELALRDGPQARQLLAQLARK